MRTTLAAAALLAAAATPPAQANEILVNARVTHEVKRDGSACAVLYMGGPITGVISVGGVVRTERPRPVADVVRRAAFQAPTDYYSEHQTFATVHDSVSVCVRGLGHDIVGGASYLAIVANGRAAAVVIVVRCTYTRDGATCH